ncbi:ABC transporter permease [Tepidiforma flava]|uniref:Transport permease protein n=1 Tax=Tepidiforma flava TaxID=3004094 RepID=A0ABY7M9M2_9CHLR|nr:ABC transporter permease [Tepidiforma flava]WBL36754.1 ABC transporter permease [Tepidiforma flava]
MTAMAMARPAQGRSLRNAVELVTALTSRDLRLRYQGSVLGWAWSLARPLALGAVLAFALGRVLGTGITAEFLLAGLFPWFWFQGAVQGAAGSFIGNGGLLKKVRFPRAVLPLSTVLGATLQFALSLPVLIGFVIAAGNGPTAAWLGLPLIFALQLGLVTGIGLFVASVTVYFRDLEHITEVLLTLLFYATPIIYSADLVPEGYRWLTYANPLAPIMEGWRGILLDGAMPAADHLAASAGLTALALAAGWGAFRRLEDGFADAI